MAARERRRATRAGTRSCRCRSCRRRARADRGRRGRARAAPSAAAPTATRERSRGMPVRRRRLAESSRAPRGRAGRRRRSDALGGRRHVAAASPTRAPRPRPSECGHDRATAEPSLRRRTSARRGRLDADDGLESGRERGRPRRRPRSSPRLRRATTPRRGASAALPDRRSDVEEPQRSVPSPVRQPRRPGPSSPGRNLDRDRTGTAPVARPARARAGGRPGERRRPRRSRFRLAGSASTGAPSSRAAACEQLVDRGVDGRAVDAQRRSRAVPRPSTTCPAPPSRQSSGSAVARRWRRAGATRRHAVARSDRGARRSRTPEGVEPLGALGAPTRRRARPAAGVEHRGDRHDRAEGREDERERRARDRPEHERARDRRDRGEPREARRAAVRRVRRQRERAAHGGSARSFGSRSTRPSDHRSGRRRTRRSTGRSGVADPAPVEDESPDAAACPPEPPAAQLESGHGEATAPRARRGCRAARGSVAPARSGVHRRRVGARSCRCPRTGRRPTATPSCSPNSRCVFETDSVRSAICTRWSKASPGCGSGLPADESGAEHRARLARAEREHEPGDVDATRRLSGPVSAAPSRRIRRIRAASARPAAPPPSPAIAVAARKPCTGMLTTPLFRCAGRSIAVVSPGRGSGRRRDSGVALVELPHSPQNIAPSGSSAPQIRHVTTWLLSASQRTRRARSARSRRRAARAVLRGAPSRSCSSSTVSQTRRSSPSLGPVGCEHRTVDDRGEHERGEPADRRRLLGAGRRRPDRVAVVGRGVGELLPAALDALDRASAPADAAVDAGASRR